MVIYKVMTRAYANVSAQTDMEKGIKLLVIQTLKSLMNRPKFAELQERTSPGRESSVMPQAKFRQCEVGPTKLPKDVKLAQNATVLVKKDAGTGSGFFISQDGFIITANHVVNHSQQVNIVMANGETAMARVVRRNQDFDVALLKTNAPADRCLPLSEGSIETGAPLYAIGSPGGEDFAFSVSRGIVSGVREIDGKRFVQTDASVNPGNSGGPLLNEFGEVLAMASWKIATQGFEGMSFGIPIQTILEKLAISRGATSTINNDTIATYAKSAEATYPIEDYPDITLEEKEEKWRKAEQKKQDAAWANSFEKGNLWENQVQPLRLKRRRHFIWGTTIAIVSLGSLFAGAAVLSKFQEADADATQAKIAERAATEPEDREYYRELYDTKSDRRDYLRTVSVLPKPGGIAVGIGALVVFLSAPKLPRKPVFSKSNLHPLAGPSYIGISGSF